MIHWTRSARLMTFTTAALATWCTTFCAAESPQGSHEGIATPASGYCVVVSRPTYADPAWRPVVEALVAKHHAHVLAYEQTVGQSLPELRKRFPQYVCFVARPGEATLELVAEVNRLMRQLDDDPYTDALWGILTGYDAGDALRIAQHQEPLVIRRVAAATEVELDLCEEGVWFCELSQGKAVRKQRGAQAKTSQVAGDTTSALVETLNDYQPQMFVTSGHATERDWQIGFRYRNGQFRSNNGALVGVDTAGRRYPVQSANPKVYLAVGNCLMGHIDGPDAMALAFLHSAGVHQMIGYTVPTWYGYGGWGLLDYFLEQPGRFTLAEAFFANQQALLHRLEAHFPGLAPADSQSKLSRAAGELPAEARRARLTWNDARGLLYDRDTVAFYGDPAWIARMAPGPLAWQQSLTEQDGQYTLEIRPLRGERTFQPVNTNGSQRGGRPIIQLLPQRIDARSVQLLEGADLKPVLTDNFILVPLPPSVQAAQTYHVVFRAKPMSR